MSNSQRFAIYIILKNCDCALCLTAAWRSGAILCISSRDGLSIWCAWWYL